MNYKIYFIFFLLALVLIVFCSCADDKHNEYKNEYEIENDHSVILFCDDIIYVAVIMNDNLYLLKSLDGNDWKTQLIEDGQPLASTHICELHCHNKHVIVSYYDITKKDVVFSDVTDANNTESTSTSSSIPAYWSADIDNNGNYYFFSLDSSQSHGTLFVYNKQTWSKKVFTFSKTANELVGIKVDTVNIIHIFINILIDHSTGCGQVLHVFGKDNDWQQETIGNCVTTNVSFALDDNDIIYLAYTEYQDVDLSVPYNILIKTVMGWQEAPFFNEIKDILEVGFYSGIHTTGDHYIHFIGNNYGIAWKDLFYLTNKENHWSKIKIAENYSESDVAFSFYADGKNLAHISYIDSLNSDTETSAKRKLYYVTDKTGEWVRHEVDFTP